MPLGDFNFDPARLRFFRLREVQGQNAVLELCRYLRLVDFVAELELPLKIDKLKLAVDRVARSGITCAPVQRENTVFHAHIDAVLGDAR